MTAIAGAGELPKVDELKNTIENLEKELNSLAEKCGKLTNFTILKKTLNEIQGIAAKLLPLLEDEKPALRPITLLKIKILYNNLTPKIEFFNNIKNKMTDDKMWHFVWTQFKNFSVPVRDKF